MQESALKESRWWTGRNQKIESCRHNPDAGRWHKAQWKQLFALFLLDADCSFEKLVFDHWPHYKHPVHSENYNAINKKLHLEAWNIKLPTSSLGIIKIVRINTVKNTPKILSHTSFLLWLFRSVSLYYLRVELEKNIHIGKQWDK
jgi:hypothetical protein